LLDASTKADQFGVSVLGREELGLAIDVQAFAASDRGMAVYALPGFLVGPSSTTRP
jgi:hypothetical protein